MKRVYKSYIWISKRKQDESLEYISIDYIFKENKDEQKNKGRV